MYYHCRQLKYVTYGKVFPPPVSSLDEYFSNSYQWLGKYCCFFPQVWLSRSTSKITVVRYHPENILFGFENIQGFPVSYDHWNFMLTMLRKDISDQLIAQYFTEIIHDMKSAGEELDAPLRDWEKSKNLDDYLQHYVFVERDQVVVSSLNLKSAKKIVCRNERQKKKKLRRMGFIEDRILIQNWKSLL